MIMRRNLVSIQRVQSIKPIENADMIEVAQILGWNIVVKKGEFKVDELVVYFEIDSYLPVDDTRFEFLAKSSYRKSLEQQRKEGYRIKTLKLRGVVSQGLVMKVSDFPEIENRFIIEGEEVTVLDVVKWDPPEISSGNVIGKNGKPFGIPTTDEIRIQSMEDILEKFIGKPYYITLKYDGTSCSIYSYNGHSGVTSRDMDLTVPESSADDNPYTTMYRSIKEKIERLGRNIVIQGELCGPRIQKNKLGLQQYKWCVFDAYDLDTRAYLDYDELKKLCFDNTLDMVSLLEEGEEYPAEYNLEYLLKKADCKYPNGNTAEGIVVRLKSMEQLAGEKVVTRASFKVINNKYLLKDDQ
ncbi:MAG: RNA ligase (ATP) [Peptococcaceae bacterium]|jgi:RNA ligase (TIGR02306 family)|nr:RNA ligase (ATP) [Peptococcaceae bacterium]